MRVSPSYPHLTLARLAMFALATTCLACADGTLGEDAVVPVVDVISTVRPLSGNLAALDGTYGAGCLARTGAWSVRVSGAGPLAYPALSVVNGNSACVLTLTALVADRTYTASPPIVLTTALKANASAFTFAGATWNEANAMLSAATFRADFVITLIVSSDPASVGTTVTTAPPATLFWFGDTSSGQGGYSVAARYAPVQEVTAVTTWSGVAAGGNTSCARRVDGTLWCWGANAQGQVGDASTTTQPIPVRIGSGSNWSRVAIGAQHTCAVQSGGSLWCWGDNTSGQVGIGNTTSPQTSPVRVGTNTLWRTIAAGGSHACALRENGNLRCWGNNTSGQLGIGNTTSPQTSDVAVGSSVWRTLAAGSLHTCAVRDDGTLWCWGNRGSAQLGNGTGAVQTAPIQIGTVKTWSMAANTLAAGSLHTCAIRENGTLWCWGNNASGQVGIGGVVTPQNTPIQVGTATHWNGVAAGGNTTCATRTDGTLWCWGENLRGQVGIGSVVSPQLGPVQVGTSTTWTTPVGLGTSHVCARAAAGALGTVWCWGSGTFGQLANHELDSASKVNFVGVLGTTWNSVGAGHTHTCASRVDGTLWCWGSNAVGQLGLGSGVTIGDAPTQVGADTLWQIVAAGNAQTCATQSNGTLWCWGENTSGELGLGSLVSPQWSPVRVGVAVNWGRVQTGSAHSCATRTDNSLWCWGDNQSGQVGIGNVVSPQTSPVQVAPLALWKYVTVGKHLATGGTHTCATRTDGTLWCWGLNTSGQIGIGNATNPQMSPVQVGTLATWDHVTGGGSHTCATRTDGTLWCWGLNTSGQLGIGSLTSPQTTPVQVGTGTTWVAVVAGSAHTCARKSDASLWCWGLNTSGQLGLGHYTSPQVSPQASGSVVRVYAGSTANTTFVVE